MKKVLPILVLWLSACSYNNDDNSSLKPLVFKEGPWLVELNLGSQILPFNLLHQSDNASSTLTIENAEESIVVKNITRSGDSLQFTIPVFGSVFKGKLMSDSVIAGFWHNPTKGKDYLIPFTARWGITERFTVVSPESAANFNGRWEVRFSPDNPDYCKAVGIFNQNGNHISGTFITETGDYRFLEGIASGNTLWLSGFDGSHAFLFNAQKSEHGSLNGNFWSGTHWHESWSGVLNEKYEVRHPDSLTTQISAIDPMKLKFSALNGDSISLEDEKFKNKVVILQVMGSWCPNCADETRDFAELYNMYNSQGLEILAVAYEKSTEFSKSVERVMKFKEDLNAKYQFVLGSGQCKSDASDQFSFLNGIKSFPTAIFIDNHGKIRKIHTGYYGPGTGPYYLKYKEECEMFVEKLLREGSASNLTNPIAVASPLE